MKLFNEVLSFKEVEVCTDYSKAQVMNKLAELYNQAKKFKKDNHEYGETQVIAVVWSGLRLKKEDIPAELLNLERGTDGSEYHHDYMITHDG